MPINPARRGTRTLLASPQSMHAAVLAAFPPQPEPVGDAARVLWRVDRDAEHDVILYLCSPERPDLTHLVEQAGWPTTSSWQTRDYTPLLERLAAGQPWAFRLTANPVRRVRDAKHPDRGAVRGHVTAAQQVEWLLTKAAGAGFTVATASDGEPAVTVAERVVKNFARQGATVTLATARFDGVLHVSDEQLLRHTLVAGLGRAKSYGCGLLTLASAPVVSATETRDQATAESLSASAG
jgi:CRISPR system Cascade subunit CasE